MSALCQKRTQTTLLGRAAADVIELVGEMSAKCQRRELRESMRGYRSFLSAQSPKSIGQLKGTAGGDPRSLSDGANIALAKRWL